jgi:hypothetical protein
LHNPNQCILWCSWHQYHKQIWREIVSRMLYPEEFARFLLKMDRQWQPEQMLYSGYRIHIRNLIKKHIAITKTDSRRENTINKSMKAYIR